MKEFRLKGGEKLITTINSFSATEKVIFGFLTIIALVSALVVAWKVNSYFLVPIPASGGSFSEAMIGLPRSINPVLAITDTDKDLSTLIYAGLMKYDGDELVPDMAESYTISEDGLVYTFKLKDNLYFHDGTPLTTDDVEFTIQKIQDSDVKSPRRVDWASVNMNKISPTEIQFTLRQPYVPFLANATIGILPKNLWKNLDADQFVFNQRNLEPVGSGPYKISGIEKDKAGSPTSYSLSAFSKYHTGKPHISHITINFYQNEDAVIGAYKNGLIENFAGLSPQRVHEVASTTKDVVIVHNPLPRIFGVFLNQNNAPVLANKEVRQALNLAADKNKIIDEVLNNYGVAINGPLPVKAATTTPSLEEIQTKTAANMQAAKDLLTKNGWQINSNGIFEKKGQILEFSIATADSADLKKAAEIVKSNWEQMGASVSIKVFEYGDLSQNIIKTRKYDALLFGEIISKTSDLYAFWHSSQRNAPGLNVSMYVNSRADGLLEEARITYDSKVRDSMYQSLRRIIEDDVPAVFLYSPEYIYLMSDKIHGYNLNAVTNHSDRFYGIEKWYIATDYVWKVF